MATDRETVDGVLMDNDNASYDKAAKRFLSMKMLLAWILKYLVAEFRDCSIKDIAEKYIEGDPTLTIGTIPVDADLTNAARNTAKKKAKNIKGSRNEDASTTEGTAIFDILFRAIVPATGETIALIINIEPQRTVYTGYSLVRRGIYYACRMISSQKEVEFTGDDYNNIKKVYTIWLVMDAPKGGSKGEDSPRAWPRGCEELRPDGCHHGLFGQKDYKAPPAEAAPPDFPGQAKSGREKDNFETGLRPGADTGHGGGVDEDGQFSIGNRRQSKKRRNTRGRAKR